MTINKMPWKHAQKAFRLTIEIQGLDDEPFTEIEDILYTELDPDTMTDFHAFYNWYGDDEWEILQVEEIEVWDWKDMRISNKWRKFYELFEDGKRISFIKLQYYLQ